MPLNTQSTLLDLLNVNPSSGNVSFCDDRMLLVSTAAMGQLRLALFRMLGVGVTRQLLTRYGRVCGQEDANRLREARPWQSDEEWLMAGPSAHNLQGVVRVEVKSCEFDRDTPDLRMTGIWHDSYEVEQHLTHFGISDTAVCWELTGYAAGYASTVWGDEVVCEEVTCRGKGDDHCRFELYLGCNLEPDTGQSLPLDLRSTMQGLQTALQERVLRLEQRTKQLDALNSVLLDLTENLERQVDDSSAEMRRSEERYRSIVKDSEDGIFVYQGEDVVIHEVNRAFARLCNRSMEDCIGISFLDLVHPDLRDLVGENAARRLRGDPNVPGSYEIKALVHDEPRYWRVTASKLTYQPRMASVIIRDITDEKLQQEKLLEQEKLAGIGLLTAGIAHEIGNPLSSISSLAQLIQIDSEDMSAQERASQIQNHVDRIVKIVTQMMEFAKPSNKEWQWVDVHEVIEGALEIARYQRGFKQLEIVRDYAELPKAYVMPEGLQQVFVNIAMNAVDAMAGDGTLTITTRQDDKDIAVAFADTGTGMDEIAQRRAFEPFFTTKEVGKGTGLGLAVSYGIIQKHGGDIQVDSRKGEGSRFTVRFPIGNASVPALAPRQWESQRQS